jgi:NAD-dependent dihydropyrimidine dehydrogenase PreA subunit
MLLLFYMHMYKIIRVYDYGGERVMAYIITDSCVSCGACESECPVEAISEGDGKYVIDADVCIDCGTCADTCPNEAIEQG